MKPIWDAQRYPRGRSFGSLSSKLLSSEPKWCWPLCSSGREQHFRLLKKRSVGRFPAVSITLFDTRQWSCSVALHQVYIYVFLLSDGCLQYLVRVRELCRSVRLDLLSCQRVHIHPSCIPCSALHSWPLTGSWVTGERQRKNGGTLGQRVQSRVLFQPTWDATKWLTTAALSTKLKPTEQVNG